MVLAQQEIRDGVLVEGARESADDGISIFGQGAAHSIGHAITSESLYHDQRFGKKKPAAPPGSTHDTLHAAGRSILTPGRTVEPASVRHPPTGLEPRFLNLLLALWLIGVGGVEGRGMKALEDDWQTIFDNEHEMLLHVLAILRSALGERGLQHHAMFSRVDRALVSNEIDDLRAALDAWQGLPLRLRADLLR